MSRFTFFALLFAGAVVAGEGATISISTSAGPGTDLMSSASMQFLVLTPVEGTLSFYSNGPAGFGCLSSTGVCFGEVDDSAGILNTNGLVTTVGFGGTYVIMGGEFGSGIDPFCDDEFVASCDITLLPGLYTLEAEIHDSLRIDPGSIGTVVPFSEFFIGRLDVRSGIVRVVPEPASGVLLPFALIAIVILSRRFRQKKQPARIDANNSRPHRLPIAGLIRNGL